MRLIFVLVVATVLLSLTAQGAAQQPPIVDPTTGNPLVDGPGPYKRLLPRPQLDRSRPLVIGHRGASGEFPEHSELAYRAAVNQGAQFIECCDIVLTADLVPVCRHEPFVQGTTNANQLFPDRVRTYNIDGFNSTGIHTVDLTLAELKTLRVIQPNSVRSQAFDGFLPVMTFEECATMAKEFYTKENIVVGIYPETKHPTWHDAFIAERWPQILRRFEDRIASHAGRWAAIQGSAGPASNSRSDDLLQEGGNRGRGGGKDKDDDDDKKEEYRKKGLPPPPTMTDIVLEIAHRLGYNNAINTPGWNQQPIFLQSFEVNNLRYARRRSQLPIVQLTGGRTGKLADNSYANYGALLADMTGIASYAQGLGPSKGTLLANWNTGTQSLQPGTSGDPVVTSARAAGLQVHLYTLRNEPATWQGSFASIEAEYNYYFKTLGVEGGFTDFPGTLAAWTRAKGPWSFPGNRWLQA